MRERSGELPHRGQRPPVGQLGHGAPQALGHRVEGAAHPTHFIATVNGYALLQVPSRNRLGGVSESTERPSQVTCEEKRQHHPRGRDREQEQRAGARYTLEGPRVRTERGRSHQVERGRGERSPQHQPILS